MSLNSEIANLTHVYLSLKAIVLYSNKTCNHSNNKVDQGSYGPRQSVITETSFLHR